ncbi:MAG TPA: ABC transporter ATP-binding protein [Dehalococcoidia bacterium]|nr:ABC transporter ATP-binding protein [Dehalococcoidia bacterium]
MAEAIRVDCLSFKYPDGRTALESVSFVVQEGENIGIVGPNGAGKSTLLLHFNGILRAPNGAVKVLGHPLTDSNLKYIRSKVGLVFQDPDDQLFSPTVFDDVAFGPINMGHDEAAVRSAVTRALELVGMSGSETRSPHHLSFGERKRIAIATVLATSPDLLVLDEPTAGLDPAGRYAMIEILRSLPATIIVASHDLDLVNALCRRIILLDSGHMVADGEAARILADTTLLASHGLAAGTPPRSIVPLP